MLNLDKVKFFYSKIQDEFLLNKIKSNRDRFGKIDPPPFFLVSAGRSGTTLLRKILMQHPDLHIPPESDGNLPALIKLYYTNTGWNWEMKVRSCLKLFQNTNCFTFWKIDLFKNCNQLIDLPLNDQNLYSIVRYIYFSHLNEYKPNAKIWGDKTPYLIFMLRWLNVAIPNARFLHIHRDGRAVVESRMRVFNEDLKIATNRWIWAINSITRFKKNNFVYEIAYEDLVSNPSVVIPKLCDFLNISFSNDMLHENSYELGDDVMSHHKNIKKAINVDLINKWTLNMHKDDIKYVEKNAQDQLKLYGYL
jgi:hypothetical protein